MENKNSIATLDELNEQKDAIKGDIAMLKKQLGRVTATIKSFQKFIAAIPIEKPKRKRGGRKSRPRASAPATA